MDACRVILAQLVLDPAGERSQGHKIALSDALRLAQQQIEHQVHVPGAQVLHKGVRHDHVLKRHPTTMPAERDSCAGYRGDCLRVLGVLRTAAWPAKCGHRLCLDEMKDASLDSPLGSVTVLADHFYRLVRRGPGLQQVLREHADLDGLKDELSSLLDGLEPGGIELHSHAVALTGTRDGEDVRVTVQYLVAQPTDLWSAAEGGPSLDWSAWHETVISEARQRGWEAR